MPIEVTDEMVVAAARALCLARPMGACRCDAESGCKALTENLVGEFGTFGRQARAAIAAVLPLIAAAEREECAKVADNAGDTWTGSRCVETAIQEAAVDKKAAEIAAAIRSRS